MLTQLTTDLIEPNLVIIGLGPYLCSAVIVTPVQQRVGRWAEGP